MKYEKENGKYLNIKKGAPLKDILEQILEAEQLAVKEAIKANSVIIDKNFAIMNGFYFGDRAFTPTVFGLKVDYANLNTNDNPFDTAFILTNHEVAPTKYEKYEQAINIIKNHKLLNYVLKNEKCAAMYFLNEEEKRLLREVVNEHEQK